MKPKLSVCMVTYNHEEYIRQAIESVFMQKTDFDFELVIGEDCSTDKTQEIVMKYKNKYPDRIRVFINKKNLGAGLNFIHTLNACKGNYVALLEGDDYWTDPHKLQKQVDLLNLNPQYSMCFHTTKAFFETSHKPSYSIPSQKRKKRQYVLEDILKYNFIASCSVMYRSNFIKKLPPWFDTLEIGDWPLHILFAMHGDIGYIDEIMAKYRIHNDSHFSSRSKILNFLDIIKTQKRMDRYLRYRYHNIICKVISDNYYLLYEEYLKINDNANAAITFKKITSPIIPSKSWKNKLGHLLFYNTILSKL